MDHTEKIDEFTLLVLEMRSAQREYFKSRSQRALDRAIMYEKMVDAEINRRFEQLEQPRLFEVEHG